MFESECVADFLVTEFNGNKRFIISTTSFMGGKNNFLGIGYVAVGSMSIVAAFVFTVIHLKFGKP
jgi:hypothetical protein